MERRPNQNNSCRTGRALAAALEHKKNGLKLILMSHIENEMENDRYGMLSGRQCHALNQLKILEMSLQKIRCKMQMSHKKIMYISMDVKNVF